MKISVASNNFLVTSVEYSFCFTGSVVKYV